MACSGGDKKRVLEVHEDFHDLTVGVGDELGDVPEIVDSYAGGDITEEEFNKIKEEKLEYVEEVKQGLGDIEKPKNGDAKEYYGKNYAVVVKSLEIVEASLDVPELDDKVGIDKYNQKKVKNERKQDEVMEELKKYRVKLSKEDKDYEEAFKID